MRTTRLTVSFSDDDGSTREKTEQVTTSYTPDASGENRLAHNLFAELKVAVADQPPPKHNAVARQWLEFPNKPASFDDYFDIQNSQGLWFELSSLVMGVESDLMLSQAYKALEPAALPSWDDSDAINDLYYIHDRKLQLLNQAVYGLIKAQDLLNRLLHESLGGDLVDTSKSDWEKTQLLRSNVEKGLDAKRATGQLSQADFDAITNALKIPKNTPKGNIAQSYRNRLMHHVRPSVDYGMFFPEVQSRAGKEIKDAQGNVIGRSHTVYAKPSVQYQFQELHSAFSEYLDAAVEMLQKLSEIEIIRR